MPLDLAISVTASHEPENASANRALCIAYAVLHVGDAPHNGEPLQGLKYSARYRLWFSALERLVMHDYKLQAFPPSIHSINPHSRPNLT